MTDVGDPLLRRAALNIAAASDTGDVLDLDALYRAHRGRLVRLAAAITLDHSIAEEVVQDAFASLQRRRSDIESPVAYLQRSVVNQSISVIRRRHTASRHPVPVAPVAVNPEIDETWGAVTALPARERAVVVLRYWLDLSESDIAASLRWPPGTVKSTLHRALKRLRKDLPQ